MPTINVPSDYATIDAAIIDASDGDIINIAAGEYTVTQLDLTSKQLTLTGAGPTSTIVTSTGNGVGLLISKSGSTVENMKFKHSGDVNNYICSIHRSLVDVDVSNISITNVVFDTLTHAKGIAVNGVSNVSFTNCVFPQTSAYSIGFASIKGCNLKGCTIPASLYGSVGIFPSTFFLGLNPQFDATTSGIDLSGNTFTDPTGNGAGVIQVQPGSGPAITYGFSSENVKLPAAFKYAYLQNRVLKTNNIPIAGYAGASISNFPFFRTPGPMSTPGTGAYYYAALQATVPNTQRVAIYGRDLSTSTTFYETVFNAEDNIIGTLSTSQLSPVTTSTQLSATVNSVFSSITPASAPEVVQAAISQIVASTSSSSVAASTTLASLIIKGNTDAAASNYTTKSAIAAVLAENASFQNVTLDTADRDAVIASIPTAKKSAAVSTYNWVVRIPDAEYIKMPSVSSSSSLTYIPAMILNQEYTLLLNSEASQPAGQPLSKVKYDGSNLLFSRSDVNSGDFVNVPIGNVTTIVRDMLKYEYPLYTIGSFGSGSNGSSLKCIPAGQRILTTIGWRAVEELRNGDTVITDKGVAVGAKIYSTTIKTTSKTAPITIPTNLFGNNLPSMPVRLSPLHAVRVAKGVWDFPFSLLRNHSSVTQDDTCKTVTYYHIELPNFLRDNLVLEGGLVAESFGEKYIKTNQLNGKKLYTYSKRLEGYTRITESYIKATKKSV